jgi:hypothetical protein
MQGYEENKMIVLIKYFFTNLETQMLHDSKPPRFLGDLDIWIIEMERDEEWFRGSPRYRWATSFLPTEVC